MLHSTVTKKSTIKSHHVLSRKKISQRTSHRAIKTKTPQSQSAVKLRIQKMSTNVHQMSADGFSGAETSTQYDLVRPRYAPEVLESILAPIANSYTTNPEASNRPMRILDLGCGTGISTKDIALYMYENVAEACEYEIYSIDPNSSMINVLEKSLTIDGIRQFDQSTQKMTDNDIKAVLDTIKLPLVASVDELPYKPGFFDGVIACQAFHWFATPRSLLNIQRILTPTGIYAFCWNYWISTRPNLDKSSVPFEDQWLFKLVHLIEPLYIKTHTPQQNLIDFRGLFTDKSIFTDKFGLDAPFSELYSIYLDPRHNNSQWMNRAFFHKRMDSISVVHTLPDEEKAAFLAQIDNLLNEETTPSRINEITNEKEWNIGFFCEVHYAQNSKGGNDHHDPFAF